MRVVVTGSTGLIGSALVTHLRGRGDEVTRLVRRPARAPDERTWDPATGELDPAHLRGADAVVNLAGAGVGDRRWTPAYREKIRASRVLGTSLLARTLAELDDGPRVLVQGSAVGWYADRGEEILDEAAPRGESFLAEVVADWEGAARPASSAGVRVALARTGIVLDRRGGALARLLPLVRLGLAGPLGAGTQFWPWISLEDEVRAIAFLLEADIEGPVNLTAPEPARCAELVRALARAHGRAAVLRVPGWALRVGLGGFADELLASQRVVPRVLQSAGFTFSHANLEDAVAALARR